MRMAAEKLVIRLNIEDVEALRSLPSIRQTASD